MNIDFAQLGALSDNISCYHGDNATGGYVNNNLSYDATEQALKVANWRIYGGGGNGKGVFFNYPAAGEDGAITIQEGMTISVVIKAELVTAAAVTTMFTWGVNGTAPSAAGSWLGEKAAVTNGVSEGYVTLTKTIAANSALIGANLDNIYVSVYTVGVKYNFYVKSVTITLPQ
jgi:hypothetical protein